MNHFCAVILGGYVNGYSIIQELYFFGVSNIALLYHEGQVASYSNKITEKHKIGRREEDVLKVLERLHKKYEKLVLYPTDDLQMENLLKIHSRIQDYCFIPFNVDNLLQTFDKAVQYQFCEKLGIPYPKTSEIKSMLDIERLQSIALPILIKPNKREDLKIKVFRSLKVSTKEELDRLKGCLENHLKNGVTFIGSEIIPGTTNGSIFAYTAYRSPITRRIENEWIGKKLAQYPNDYGVFSSASNEAPEIVREQGRKLLNGMNLYGICEPEFKLDPRDGKYKLMEINLRSMMWHRTGNLSGVYLQYTQWCDAIGKTVSKYKQKETILHFCYLKHEIVNVIFRKGYCKEFKSNLKFKNTYLALWDKSDMRPFIRDQFSTIALIFKFTAKKILEYNA